MVEAQQINKTGLFQGVPAEILQKAAELATLKRLAPGEYLLRSGELPEAIYFILSGSVLVSVAEEGGPRHELAVLAEGEMAGERALLTGERRAADLTARTELLCARIAKEDFENLLRLCPELYANLCRNLARQLGNWTWRHREGEREHKEILTNLVGWQMLPEFDSFPGVTPWATSLNRHLESLGDSEANVLIIGERGSWKELAARLIHYNCGDKIRPILHLDCSNPPPILVGGGREDELLREIAQESALFGHEPDSATYARGTRRGYLELADGGELILENVEALSRRNQALLADYLESRSFVRRGEAERRGSRVRIIATSDEDVAGLTWENRFDRDLFDRLGEETVFLLPLRKRKKDIPVIARRLLAQLNQKHHKEVGRLSQDAINTLLDYDWPLNGSELQQVIDLAVAVCDGDQIEAEQIFLHISPFSDGGKFNLLGLPAVGKIARSRLFPEKLRALSVPAFLLAALYCLLGPQQENLANLLVWTLWWPSLIVSVVFGARIWCSCCPVEALGAVAGSLRRKFFQPPRLLRKHGGTAAMLGVVAILLLERVAEMSGTPRATGILFLTLFACASVMHLLFGARAWCKYLCPLGRMIGQCAKISVVEMRSNANVCTSQCQVDECIKGKDCPMGLHPTAVDTSDDCVLCFSCVKNCPHNSVRLDLRPPWLGVMARQRRSFAGALFAEVLLAAVIGACALPRLPALPTAAAFFALVAAFAAAVVLASTAKERGTWKENFIVTGYAYLPLALAGMFNLYFREFVAEGHRIMPMATDLLGLDGRIGEALTPELGTLRLLFPIIVLAGGSFSCFLLREMKRSHPMKGWNCLLHRLIVALTTLALLILL